MEKSETIDKLAIALVAVQKVLEPAIKDKDNPFFRSKYADLGGVWDAFSDALAANGLALVQLGRDSEPGTISLTTMLVHTSGQWISGVMTAKLVKDDPQGYGSGITYLRRYGAAALIGVRTEDDDGAMASGTTTKESPVVTKNVNTVAQRYSR